MKVGSLVERVPVRGPQSEPEIRAHSAAKAAGYRWPVIGGIYTVRELTGYGCVGLLLEEIINPKLLTTGGMVELSFDVIMFREVQPPMSLEFIEEMQHPLTLLTESK